MSHAPESAVGCHCRVESRTGSYSGRAALGRLERESLNRQFHHRMILGNVLSEMREHTRIYKSISAYSGVSTSPK
jgi:hypothetical protein